MLAEVILGYLGKSALGHAASKWGALLKKKSAAKELAKIGEVSVEAAIRRVPSLAEDLRSRSFISGVFVPMLEAVVRDPSNLPDPHGLSAQFIDMFVAQFATDDGADETLVRLFQTKRSDLVPAFEAMLTELRSNLFSSEHWRDIPHLQSTEEIRSNVAVIRGILEAKETASAVSEIDLDAAQKDATNGSAELRNWPKDIAGQEIARPELDRLMSHMEAVSAGTSILIGEAGSGKSALLADLTARLEQAGVTVFALKADTIPADVQTIDDIGRALGMSGPLDLEIAALAARNRVVLIIDQLDAVSDVMDRSSTRMRLLLRLVRQVRDQKLGIHVIVSSRPFEAAHDARFQQLKAEEFALSLPPIERIFELLDAVGVQTGEIDKSLHETIRRPFALKLFVDLIKRGIAVKSILPGQLLDQWLTSADLGPDAERTEALTVMERLAAEMIDTETLWRPADVYEAKSKSALARCEACGLIVRSGQKIGFSHQSWLDDFQAKGFRSGKDLADYAWRNQDSLFVRATALRSLQRLRMLDEAAYRSAVQLLLFDPKTRRHLKHLIVDVISANSEPLPNEAAWLETLVRADPILANRGLGKVAERWDGWRDRLRHLLPELMRSDQFEWRAVQLLAAEARHDADHVTSLIAAHWSGEERDPLVFRVIEQAGVITPTVEKLIRTILERTRVDQFAISHFVTALRAEGRLREACRITAIWAATLEVERHSSVQLHDVGKLAEAAPLEFAQEMLPWFLFLASREVETYRDGVRRFPASKSLPWDWDFDRGRDSLIEALRHAMKSVASSVPGEARELAEPLYAVEIEQIQEIAADTLGAGGAALASASLEFLLADERRFQIGDAHVNLEPGLSGTESGLCTQELIEAIAPHLSDDQLAGLRDRIEGWSIYGPEFAPDSEPELKRQRLKWIDQNRMELLERLPPHLICARRRRQIREWRAVRPKPLGRTSVGEMATFVGSPMPVAAMTKASDDAIINMLDEISDAAPEPTRRRPIARDGGVTELSRAFAAFGKEQPERALSIAETRLIAGRHEHAAGALIEELSKESDVAPERLVAIIHQLSAKGFDSRSWKRDAAWALSNLASKLDGLDEPTIVLLAGWVENDPELIERQIEARLTNDALNAERNVKDRTVPDAILFDRYNGFRVLPQDNYTIVSAIFQGLMNRKERDFDGWLTLLESHADKPDDPHIWESILIFEGRWLFWADRPRVTELLDKLWRRDPRIFDEVDLLQTIWGTRAMFSPQLIRDICLNWLSSDDERKRQGAAEFIQAGLLVNPDDELFQSLESHLGDGPSDLLTGRLFSAAAAWREDDPSIRSRAHAVLMRFAKGVSGDQAHAMSAAVDKTDRLVPDELTRELILAVADNPDLLSNSLNGRFADGLQGLLLYPGFDEPVMHVTEKIADLIVNARGGRYRGIADQDFVQVTIALQRNDGPLRSRAMDAYERLLDAGAYGAEEAARAASGR